MKFKRFFLGLIATAMTTFFSPGLYAQDYDPSLGTQLRDGYFSPSSPEASSMVKYGSDAKANHRTGAISLSIPFYTYKDNDLRSLYPSITVQAATSRGLIPAR